MPKPPRVESIERAGSIPDAVARLQSLRAEHSPLLSQIAGDPGMTPATRLALLEHLRQEEDERLAQIAALAGASRAASAPAGTTPPPPAPSSGLTVGSLRSPVTGGGSLRASAAAPRVAGGGTVGSLRSR